MSEMRTADEARKPETTDGECGQLQRVVRRKPDYTNCFIVEKPSQVTVAVWWEERKILIDRLGIVQNAVVETEPAESVE